MKLFVTFEVVDTSEGHVANTTAVYLQTRVCKLVTDHVVFSCEAMITYLAKKSLLQARLAEFSRCVVWVERVTRRLIGQ